MKVIVTIFIISILTASLWSLSSSYYVPLFHDQYQAERVYEMTKSLAYGQIPPRYVSDIGYGLGYPLFNFYGPFPYYIGSIFYLFGIDLIIATKLMIIIGFSASFFTMWYASARIWGKYGGLLSAVLYTFAPYHAVQLYVRGAIGELYAYAALPLVVLGLYELCQKKISQRNLILSIAGFTIVLISHTISLYMTSLFVLPIAASILVYRWRKKVGLYEVISFITIPYLLTAYFWLPALTELRFTQLNTSTGNDVYYADHFVDLRQLWNSPWGYGGSATGINDGMSFMIGKAAILLSLFAVVIVVLNKKVSSIARITSGLLAIGTGLYIFLMTPASQMVWQIIPMMNLIQFPWRFLMFASLCTAFLAGLLGSFKVTQQYSWITLIGIAVVGFQLVFSMNGVNGKIKFFVAPGYYQKNVSSIIDQRHLQEEVSIIGDEYLYRDIENPMLASMSCTMRCRILEEKSTPDEFTYTVFALRSGFVTFPKAYFPGFQAFSNQIPVTLQVRNGLMGVELPDSGTYEITFKLFDSPIRAVANTISFATLTGLFIIGLVKKYRDQVRSRN